MSKITTYTKTQYAIFKTLKDILIELTGDEMSIGCTLNSLGDTLPDKMVLLMLKEYYDDLINSKQK